MPTNTSLDRDHVLARSEDHAAYGDHALLIECLTDHREGFVGAVPYQSLGLPQHLEGLYSSVRAYQ
jgi:hypothetical protein